MREYGFSLTRILAYLCSGMSFNDRPFFTHLKDNDNFLNDIQFFRTEFASNATFYKVIKLANFLWEINVSFLKLSNQLFIRIKLLDLNS